MIKKLSSFFSNTQSRFSYRQRFLFFSMIFVIVMPFPTFWMLGMQNFFIHRMEKQLIGQQYARHLKNILHTVEQYRILFLAPNPDDVILLEKVRVIDEEFSKLTDLQENTIIPPQMTFGRGFSTPYEASLNLQGLKKNWSQLIQESSLKDPTLFQNNYNALTRDLANELSELGYSYGLFLSQIPIYNDLMRMNLIAIPKVEQSIIHALILCLNSQQKALPPNQLKNQNLDLAKTDFSGDLGVPLEVRNEGMLALRLLQENSTDFLDELEKVYSINPQNNSDLLFLNRSPPKLIENFQKSIARFNESKKSLLTEEEESIDFQTQIDQTFQLINTSETISKMNNDYADHLIQKRLSSIRLQQNAGLIVLIFSCLMVICYCVFHVLSIHLVEMCNHIKEMAKGNFKTCFCSNAKDEFGSIGRSLDKMGNSIQEIVRELGQLGRHLNDFTGQINQAAKEQEETVTGQQTNIREIEIIAEEITKESNELANAMNLLTENTRLNASHEIAKNKIDLMQTKMEELASTSKKIIQGLDSIQVQVKMSHDLIKFMNKVSDGAARLHFNCAIENAHVEHTPQNFNKITREINRFAEKTSVAIQDIKKGIQGMSTNVENVLSKASLCSKDIHEVGMELRTMSFELNTLSKQGNEQVRKFEGINEVMKIQAFAALNIVESLKLLVNICKENSESIHALHCTTDQLNLDANQLQKVIESFFNKEDGNK